MKRSLVLAGGGMRVAWQAGVVKALAEEGLAFQHIDGTSGGILTAGMMLSGIPAEEMCRRWSGVDVKDFSSALPFASWARSSRPSASTQKASVTARPDRTLSKAPST